MEFIVRECPNNGIFGGSFEKTITAYIVPQHSSAEISIEQLGERIITDGVEITTSIKKKLLPNYQSADFMIGENNRLISYEDVLSEAIFSDWCMIQKELDIVHNVILYSLSNVEMPVDMKCAFLIEGYR